MSHIEFAYLLSGIVLPLFYAPQVIKILNDDTLLSSYSLSKSTIQGALRFPALLFGIYVVNNALFTLIVSLDLLGRSIEFGSALWSLRRQGCSPRQIFRRMTPWHSQDQSEAYHASDDKPCQLARDEPLVTHQSSHKTPLV